MSNDRVLGPGAKGDLDNPGLTHRELEAAAPAPAPEPEPEPEPLLPADTDWTPEEDDDV